MSDYCELCNRVVNTGYGMLFVVSQFSYIRIIPHLQDDTCSLLQPHLESSIITWCKQDPTSSSTCVEYVREYLPMLKQMAQEYPPQELCNSFGLCDQCYLRKCVLVHGLFNSAIVFGRVMTFGYFICNIKDSSIKQSAAFYTSQSLHMHTSSYIHCKYHD